MLGDRSYQYLTTDDMKMLADDSISPIKVKCHLHVHYWLPHPAESTMFNRLGIYIGLPYFAPSAGCFLLLNVVVDVLFTVILA